MSEVKPIETFYNGYRFRSRLEARWAVFFDAAGIRYQYEPEGFKLSDGTYYLPDFYLPDVESRCGKGLWVDVKSGKPGEDLSKVEQFAIDVGQIAVLYPFDGGIENLYYYHDEAASCDFPFYFSKCPQCGVITYEYPEDYGHHEKDCDKKYYEMREKANEIKDFICHDHKINTKDMSMDDVEQLLKLLNRFCYEYHDHEDYLKYEATKAKQARFEYGEKG